MSVRITSDRDPMDWIIEVCAVCGGQLGPGVGSRTNTGRCVVEEHHSTGGVVVRVAAKPADVQGGSAVHYLGRLGLLGHDAESARIEADELLRDVDARDVQVGSALDALRLDPPDVSTAIAALETP